jgi:hypothetical protein
MTLSVHEIPLYKVKMHAEAPVVDDLRTAVEEALKRVTESERFRALRPGSSIAITAGSRGITNIVEIYRHVVHWLQNEGYKPFLFSAMGSHGRGEAAGQCEVLESLGLTPENINCPVSCSDEVVLVDELEAFGQIVPMYCAKEALEADAILVLNRIKPHTSFHGRFESGLLKMMTVGLGRAKGASVFHSQGAKRLAEAVALIGSHMIRKAPIIGGIAILENAEEQTGRIEGIPHAELMEKEEELLLLAKQLVPKLPFKQADLCIVGEMGKNYSGTGMDTNVIGRLRIQGSPEPESPYFTYLGVLRLSEASHGNATGIGLADFTTEKLVEVMDKKATYLNCLTSGFVMRAAVPLTLPTDCELLEAAITGLKVQEASALRMVVIHNTLHINTFWVTKPIYQEIQDTEGIQLLSGPDNLRFDEQGNWEWNE